MKILNMLDAEGLRNLGIEFETEEEMEAFARILRDNLESRVGNEMTKSMSNHQMLDYHYTAKRGEAEAQGWIREHCPQYKEAVRKIAAEIKEELLDYSAKIPGIKDTAVSRWNARHIEDFEDITLREIKQLKLYDVTTLGELYALDYDTLCEIFRREGGREKKIKELWSRLDESRRQARLHLLSEWEAV